MQNLKLKGSKNIRDLSGIKSKSGCVKKGTFLRGGHLHNITNKDISVLKDTYNLTAIIDLRSTMETIEKPDVVIPGVEYHHFPIFDEAVKGVTHEEKTDSPDKALRVPDLSELYETMVSEECTENLSKIFEFLLNRKADGGAVLIHCTEGKDRTGIVTLILLLLLDVPLENIMEDYMYTNTVNRKKSLKYYYFIRIFKRDKKYAEKIRDAFIAKEDYLNSAIGAIEKNWGDAENFVNRALGIDSDTIKHFREEFLIDS